MPENARKCLSSPRGGRSGVLRGGFELAHDELRSRVEISKSDEDFFDGEFVGASNPNLYLTFGRGTRERSAARRG
jgi:hypothetical protein